MLNLVVLFALLGCSQAFISLGACPDKEVVENFNAAAYLGEWFEAEAYGNAWERLSVTCPKAVYSLNETTGNVIVANSGMSRVNPSKEIKFIGEATVVAPGKLNVTFNFNGLASMSAPYWVIGTDYNKWAIVYSCVEFRIPFKINADASWILTRERYVDGIPKEIDDQINATLTQAGIDRKRYTKISQKGCTN